MSPVPMRAVPTVTFTGTATGAFFTTVDDANYANMTYSFAYTGPSQVGPVMGIAGTMSIASGAAAMYIQNNRKLAFSAEL